MDVVLLQILDHVLIYPIDVLNDSIFSKLYLQCMSRRGDLYSNGLFGIVLFVNFLYSPYYNSE